MIESNYSDNKWDKPKVYVYAPLSLDPKSKILHYGQGVFEGMKAYPAERGHWSIFRLSDHYDRFAHACSKLAIPVISKEYFEWAIRNILHQNKPQERPLYIRPFVFSTESDLAPFGSKTFKFLVIAEEVDPHFKKESINIISAISQRNSSPSGTSDIKTGGNYAACMLAEMGAKDKGADMVLWLDENKRIVELSGMNIFFVSKGVLYTPESGTILKGITRDSIIRIAGRMRIEVVPGYFGIKALYKADEVFASGTRCDVVPITEIDGECFNIGPITRRIGKELSLVKRGIKDVYEWTKKIKYRDKN